MLCSWTGKLHLWLRSNRERQTDSACFLTCILIMNESEWLEFQLIIRSKNSRTNDCRQIKPQHLSLEFFCWLLHSLRKVWNRSNEKRLYQSDDYKPVCLVTSFGLCLDNLLYTNLSVNRPAKLSFSKGEPIAVISNRIKIMWRIIKRMKRRMKWTYL